MRTSVQSPMQTRYTILSLDVDIRTGEYILRNADRAVILRTPSYGVMMNQVQESAQAAQRAIDDGRRP